MVGVVGLTGVFIAPVSTAAADSDTVALTGQVDTPASLEDARFKVWIDLSGQEAAKIQEGATEPMMALDAAEVVSTNGSTFTVSIDPADVPEKYISSNNLVSLEVEIYDPQSNTYAWTTQSVRLVGGAAKSWADPLETAPGAVATLRSSDPTPPAVTLHLAQAPQGVTASFSRLRADTCTTTKVGHSDVYATIGTAYPGLPGYGTTYGSAWMTHSSGSEITYGAAVSDEGTRWSASGSASVSNTNGFDYEWAPSSKMLQAYQTQVRYYKYKRACGGVVMNWTMKAVEETGVVKTHLPDGNPPYWLSSSKCGFSYPAGTWSKTTGRAYSFSSGVKISSVIGIELSTSRAYTSSSKLSYRMDAAHDSLCGDTDKPNLAGKVQQYYNRIEEEL